MSVFRIKNTSADILLIKITSLAWLIAKIMSFKLWTADRSFPIIPTIDFLTTPNWVHLGLYGFSLVAISALVIVSNKQLILFVIIAEITTCLLDQMRWQPWQFQYLLTFLFFYLSKDKRQFLSLVLLMMASTYFFSGIHKFSGSFLYTIWDKLVLNRIFGVGWTTIKNPIIHYAGLIIPSIEIFIGAALLLLRNRKLL